MTVRPHPSVIFKAVSDGAVLLHTESEVYFGLNHVGARVWEMIPGAGTRRDDLVQRLAEAYPDVGVETLEQDVGELLGQLAENGLILVGDPDGAPSPTAA
ncbi:MAG: PqqD family protein [Gemmatimonadota bacterium]|nr:PqqD family protein [Gemmatimonadota bacterium]